MSVLSYAAVQPAQFDKPARSGLLRLPTTAASGSFDSKSLLRGTREVLIRHGGETYRLRHTRNDKLILTK